MSQAVTLLDRAAAFRPRRAREVIVLGRSTILARRVVERGCYCVDKPDDDALAALLSFAYEKRISADDPMVRAILRAADVLLRTPEHVDALLAALPEPAPAGITRLPQAERLLKAGVVPADLAKAMRRDRLGLREAPAYADRLTLCDQGVVLGKGTVIAALEDAPGAGASLALKGREERILALLSVASGQATDANVLTKFEAASRALRGGNVSLAAIHLAHAGLEPLAHTGMAKALSLAADKLDGGTGPFDLLKGLDLLPADITAEQWRKYVKDDNPDEPRDYHGRWTTGGGGTATKPDDGRVQVADNRPFNTMSDASSTHADGQQVALNAIERAFIPPELEGKVKSVLSNVTNGTLSSDEVDDLYDAVVRSIDEDQAKLFANVNPNNDVISLSERQFKIVEQQINAVEDPDLKAKAQAGLDQALANGKVRVR